MYFFLVVIQVGVFESTQKERSESR